MNRIFFIYQMSLEQKTNEIFSKYLKSFNCSKHLMIMDSERVNLNYDFNDFDDVMVLNKIYYSKNLPKIFRSKKKLRNKLKNLNVGKNDLLISPPLFDLANIIIFDFFKSKSAKTLIYSFNGIKPFNKNFSFNLKKSLLYSLNTLLISKKTTYVFNIKNTPHKYPFMRIKTDYFVDIGASNSEKKYIDSKNFFKVKNLDFNSSQSNEVLILINTNKINELTGLNIDEYFKKVNYLISKLKNKFRIKIKDHPSSKFTNEFIIKNINIDNENIINKKISFEDYLDENNPKYILGQGSNTMLYAKSLGINCLSIGKFMNPTNPDLFSKVYGFDGFKEELVSYSNVKNTQTNKLKKIVNLIMDDIKY